MSIVISFLVYLIIVLGVIFFAPRLIWAFSPLFRMMNNLHWLLLNPFRFLFKNKKKSFARGFYYIFYAGYVLYWLILYWFLFPVRLVNSFYYNIALFLSVNVRDAVSDLAAPTSLNHLSGSAFAIQYVLNIPIRFLQFLVKNGKLIIHSIMMFLVDLVLPSLTMYHGTNFKNATLPILNNGKWKVGAGDFAGLGIYFSIDTDVAQHYAGHKNGASVIVSRVSLGIVRPITSLKRDIRKYAGTGGQGQHISSNAGFMTTFLEHFRHDRGGWWEYCLPFPGQLGNYVKTWRIRPLCVLKVKIDANNQKSLGQPMRVPNGISFWPNSGKAFAIAVAAILFLITIELPVVTNFFLGN